MEKLNFTEVPISNIVPDPNQPRHFFDPADMEDLTNSIREKDVLQPILIRPVKGKKDQYMVVCGERRYRAAKSVMTAIKDRNTIPAIVRDVSDDEALELQIIENLQRKDVSPMEEAVAFLSLSKKGKTNVDIGKRVGKSEFYIRQRLKLNQLIKPWQTALYGKRIDLVLAIEIAAVDPEAQQELWDDEGDDSTDRLNIDSHDLRRYKGKLSEAPFDITDPNLDKKMGACTGCPFNSASAQLFPGDEQSPRCLKVTCFNNKSFLAFDKELQIAVDDPSILLVNTEYSAGNDEVIKAITKAGHTVLNGRYNNNFRVIDAPEKPDLEDYSPDNYKNNSRDLMMADYEKDVKRWEKEMADHNKLTIGGKYKKAFSVYGSTRGHYVYLQMGASTSSSTPVAQTAGAMKDKEAAGKLTAADIDAEIKRINERLERGAVLDLHKVHVATLEQFNKRPEASSSKPKLLAMHKADRGILAYLLVEMIGTHNTVSGMPKYSSSKDKYNESYFDELTKISDQQLALLIRVAVKKKFGTVNLQYGLHTSDTPVRIISQYLGIDIKKIEADVKVSTDKRVASAKKRIDELRKLKGEIGKPAKAVEKPVNGSAAPAPVDGKKVTPNPAAKKAAPKKKAAVKKKVARAANHKHK